jgi:hypothetical protein
MQTRTALGRLAITLALTACGEDEPERREPAPVAEELSVLAGPVVATVNGTAITLGEVEDVVRRTGLSPRDALTRLEEEVVLIEAAGEPDDASRREAEHVLRRAAVQALIVRDVEERIRPDTLDPEAVRARLERDAAMFAQPERRASVHVLCRPNDGAPPEADAAAERHCRGVLAELVAAADPRAAAEAHRGTDTSGRTFQVLVETVPPARREGELAEEYAVSLFSLAEPGVAPELAHTRFGWHVVVLTEIVPPWSIPPEEAERIVRRQMAAEARALALDALGTELLARTPVTIDPVGLDLALRAPLGAPSGAPGAAAP